MCQKKWGVNIHPIKLPTIIKFPSSPHKICTSYTQGWICRSNSIDNVHILVKLITENSNPEMLFISFEEPEVKSSIERFNVIILIIKISLCKLFGWDKILPRFSYFITVLMLMLDKNLVSRH